MKTCRALVWDGVDSLNGRCNREAKYHIANVDYCDRCAKMQLNYSCEYATQYLDSILLRLNDMDLSLLVGKETEMFLLKNSIQNSLDLINKIKN